MPLFKNKFINFAQNFTAIRGGKTNQRQHFIVIGLRDLWLSGFRNL
ncbi:hypothetical protein H6F41_08985 [Pseudanabaena sp. FACHB-723]|uniref:Uncharacterized protein n=1 Tax=Pseudanabaena mucicola FACHB-723 TaxID=2692860 RepID=A0ABR7ZWE0_9CYAN|nr:hypothetical protein [Pseudanabaena mucicola FACHB-723]